MGLENFQHALGILAPPKVRLSSMPFLDVQQPHTPTRIIRALLISTSEQLDLHSLKAGVQEQHIYCLLLFKLYNAQGKL